MNILSIDCEYNQPSGKTIQIGAGVYGARDGKLVEKLDIFVNPNELINPEITTLTSITDAQVSGGMSILEAYNVLKALHAKHKCFKNPLVWGSGVRNDSDHIYKEAYPTKELQDANPNFMGYRVLDVKSIYQSINMYQNKLVRGGLESSCKNSGIGFEGAAHTAFADAHNTFRLWFHLVKRFNP